MYPLSLSVIHDGASYEARKHAARKLFEGYHDRPAYFRDIRAICALKARDERASFGVKIKPADITAQAREVADYMETYTREAISTGYTGAQCIATIRRWFDKVNGNSYFVAWVRIPQSNGGYARVKVPYQYGSGSHPEWETVRHLKRLGLFSEIEGDTPSMFPIVFEDQGYMPRRTL